jgi:hypothetical protein
VILALLALLGAVGIGDFVLIYSDTAGNTVISHW